MPPDCPDGSFPLGITAKGESLGCGYVTEARTVPKHEHVYPDLSLVMLAFFLGYFLRGVLRG